MSGSGAANKRQAERTGRRAETLCAWWLRLKGYRIVARRSRQPGGEIDLIAVRLGVLAMIEVKARASLAAEVESVSVRQQARIARIARAAQAFISSNPRFNGLTVRFDLMLVVPRRPPVHIANAWHILDRSEPHRRKCEMKASSPRRVPTVAVHAASLMIALSLGACQSLLLGGAAVVGVAAVQERSVGAALDDAAIQLVINQRLLEVSETLFARIGIEVVEGRVLLTGNVPTPDDRVAAVRAAWQVDGVREVLNEIQVADRDSIVAYFNDARITAQLRFQLLTDADVADINYSVDTVNGVIYLMGIGLDQTEMDRVTDYARAISGVQNVISHVRLADDPRR